MAANHARSNCLSSLSMPCKRLLIATFWDTLETEARESEDTVVAGDLNAEFEAALTRAGVRGHSRSRRRRSVTLSMR